MVKKPVPPQTLRIADLTDKDSGTRYSTGVSRYSTFHRSPYGYLFNLFPGCDGLIYHKTAIGLRPHTLTDYRVSFAKLTLFLGSDPPFASLTNMTGDLGDQVLSTLTTSQAQLITGLVDLQKPSLLGIVDTRRQVSVELRKFLAGETSAQAAVLALMGHYGELDGEIIYNMAVHFTQVSQSPSSDQKAKLVAMRQQLLGDLSHPTGAYLYSQPIPMPTIPSSDFLFK